MNPSNPEISILGDSMTGAALLKNSRANKAMAAQRHGWTAGKALFACSVQSSDVTVNGRACIPAATRVSEFIFDRGEPTVRRPGNVRVWLEAMTYKLTDDGKAA